MRVNLTRYCESIHELSVSRLQQQVTMCEPEDEDEEHEKSTEGSDAVHCLEHDDQLVLKGWHEPHQFEYTQ